MNVKDNKRYDQVLSVISTRIKLILTQLDEATVQTVQEIRLRINSPVVIVCLSGSRFLNLNGKLTSVFSDNCVITTPAELSDTLNRVCSFSLHTNQQGINSGFVTITGGHRVGICGTAVYDANGIVSVRDIFSINIRIAREKCGVASQITETLMNDGLKSIIVAGPPSSGKTTLLRDLSRQLSSGYTGRYVKTVVVDERGEFAAVSNGIPQNDLGLNTDILSNYKKSAATELAIRSLSPEYIIFDEICSDEDLKSVEKGLNSGVNFAVSVHASNEYELRNKPIIRRLILSQCFSYIVMLKNFNSPCEIDNIIRPEVRENEIYWTDFSVHGMCSYGDNIEIQTSKSS